MARTAQSKVNGNAAKLFVAFELSQKSWRVVCSDGVRTTEAAIPFSRVLDLIKQARRRLATGSSVLTC